MAQPAQEPPSVSALVLVWAWCRSGGGLETVGSGKLSTLRECRKDGGYGTKSRQAGLKNVHSEHEFCLLRQ